MPTTRDLPSLMLAAATPLSTRRQHQTFVYTSDDDGRITRRRMAALTREGFFKKVNVSLVSASNQNVAPCYALTELGYCYLAEKAGDHRYAVQRPPQRFNPLHLSHSLVITDFYILLQRALELLPNVRMVNWWHEWHIINPDESDSKAHRSLLTRCPHERKIVCAPDFAYSLEITPANGEPFVAAFFGEIERANNPRQTAARKHKGYDMVYQNSLVHSMFPEVTTSTFGVICVSTQSYKRLALWKAMKGKLSDNLWRFAAMDELTPDNLLVKPVFYRTSSSTPISLIPEEAILSTKSIPVEPKVCSP